ncbi:MAG: hypothetical protein ABI592_11905 [Acidobacteriota bacterium]
MIVYEEGTGPVLRAAEFDLGGRRVAVRAWAYSGEIGDPFHRFDPIDRTFIVRRPSGTLHCGPGSPAAWAEAFARTPPGPAMVQGASAGETVRGSYRAAVEGAIAARRGAYLLDPPPGSYPEATAAGPPEIVVLRAWSPAGESLRGGLAEASARGVPAGVVWPVIAGWTEDPGFLLPFLEDAARGGARFALPVAPSQEAEFRRGAVEARTATAPHLAEALFDTLYHTPWEERVAESLEAARAAAARAGLATLPPRPASGVEPRVNVRAAERLEEMARDAENDHRASLLHAAVRWIDGCGRDLSAILREGNFAKAFPFGRELARETEDALREAAG